MKYAENTVVSVAKSRAEIEDLLQKSRATSIGFASEEGRSMVVFGMSDRRISFMLMLPSLKDFEKKKNRYGYVETVPAAKALADWEQACRSKWRALFLTIKAKLVSVESQIETLEEAFLAHIMVPTEDGMTKMGPLAIKAIHAAYVTGKIPPLMLGAGS